MAHRSVIYNKSIRMPAKVKLFGLRLRKAGIAACATVPAYLASHTGTVSPRAGK